MHSVFPIGIDPHKFLDEPSWFGTSPSVARYDLAKDPFFNDLTERQKSYFWRPSEIQLTLDQKQFRDLKDHEKHTFISNLKYQTLLDSVQGRAPTLVLQQIVSQVDLETWLTTWAFSETVHSESYTHIIKNIFPDSNEIFNDIPFNKEIMDRARDVNKYYDDLLRLIHKYHYLEIDLKRDEKFSYEIHKALYLALVSVNALEACRFNVSFVCSFSYAERPVPVMEGNANIITLISRDETLHFGGTARLLNNIHSGIEGDFFRDVSRECKQQATQILVDVNDQEHNWADYLFQLGDFEMLTKQSVKDYSSYISAVRSRVVGLPIGDISENPLPWTIKRMSSDSIRQTALQEKQNTAYLVGAVDSNIDTTAYFEKYGTFLNMTNKK
jgi:ribonucleoside-diphosphate reductase beta chain